MAAFNPNLDATITVAQVENMILQATAALVAQLREENAARNELRAEIAECRKQMRLEMRTLDNASKKKMRFEMRVLHDTTNADLQNDITALRSDMREHFEHQEVLHHNNEARLFNSHFNMTGKLEPLRSLRDSRQKIEDFPTTIKAIDALSGLELDRLLVELEVPAPPLFREKKSAFMSAVGAYYIIRSLWHGEQSVDDSEVDEAEDE